MTNQIIKHSGNFKISNATNAELVEYINSQLELFRKYKVNPELVYRCEIQIRDAGAVLVDRKELLSIDYDNRGMASTVALLSRSDTDKSHINEYKNSKYNDYRNNNIFATTILSDSAGLELGEVQGGNYSL